MTQVICINCGAMDNVAFEKCGKCGSDMVELQDNFNAMELSLCDKCTHQNRTYTGTCWTCVFSPLNR